jgi:hypothetical protein
MSPDGTIDHLDGYLDNLTNKDTQEKSTIMQLVNNNTSLTKSFEALAAACSMLAGQPTPVTTLASTP